MVPLFDTLAHPTVNGSWLGKGDGNTFTALQTDLEEAGYMGACAVGLAGVDAYDHASFSEACNSYPSLVPIAGFSPKPEGVLEELREVKRLGFSGIKIHPRFSNLKLEQESDLFVETLRGAAAEDLVVFLCTYNHTNLSDYPDTDPFFSTVRILKAAPDTRVVLVHGGDVQLMRYAELVRFNPQLILDLSLTMMKYQGSSLDKDMSFLFRYFDRRICIGTDHPEHSHAKVRQRFEELAADVPLIKQENAGFRNITQFLGVGDQFA